MHALDWLGELAQWVLALIPRLILVRKTHGAVRFTKGHAVALNPGLHLYWPVWSEVQKICIVRQTIDLPYQSLITSDGKSITVAVVVVYGISNPMAALTITDNVVDTIRDVSMWAILRVATAYSFEELRTRKTAKGRSIDRILRAKLASDLAMYGVDVQQAFIAEFSAPRTFRIMGETACN